MSFINVKGLSHKFNIKDKDGNKIGNGVADYLVIGILKHHSYLSSGGDGRAYIRQTTGRNGVSKSR